MTMRLTAASWCVRAMPLEPSLHTVVSSRRATAGRSTDMATRELTDRRQDRSETGGTEYFETLIIGGGQAGLASAHNLKKPRRTCLLHHTPDGDGCPLG